MSIYKLTREQAAIACQHIDDKDWAPPGGTSTRRYFELAHVHAVAFVRELTRRLAEHDEQLWAKFLDSTIHLGWRDDPGGDYYVSHGLEHLHHVPEHQLRSFCYLAYVGNGADGARRHDDNIGLQYFEAPYTHDAVLKVDHLMVWLDAHRRTLTTRRKESPR